MINYKVLVADDEPNIRELFKEILEDSYTVDYAANGKEAIDKLKNGNFDIAIIDVRMPGASGIDVLRWARESDIKTRFIVITAFQDIETAIEAMKLGAYDYIVKPFDTDKILTIIKNLANEIFLSNRLYHLANLMSRDYTLDNFIGKSKAIYDIKKQVEKIANIDTPVLIVGESGTGKELLARIIHYISKRKLYDFVAIDCAAIPETLIESELFGYEKGAFTGATTSMIGKIEMADKGTLFLDEIGNMSLSAQSKLLRVLQEREFTRLGSNKKIRVDIRVISATNANLEKAIEDGSFRLDLYYRINTIPIVIPPLRERKEDIPLLIDYYLQLYNREMNKGVRIEDDAITLLVSYKWPGNVRELQNIMQRFVIMKNDIISASDVSMLIGNNIQKSAQVEYTRLEDVEREHILKILDNCNNDVKKAADILGVSVKTIYNKLAKYKNQGYIRG